MLQLCIVKRISQRAKINFQAAKFYFRGARTNTRCFIGKKTILNFQL